MWCPRDYLRVLAVKYNELGTKTLKFMPNQFKSKKQIYSKYNRKLNFDNVLSNTAGSTWDSINIIQNGKF